MRQRRFAPIKDRATATAAGLLACAFTSGARADSKVLSGASCVLVTGTNVTRSAAGIKNNETGNVTVFCSLLRDNTTNTNGLTALRISATASGTLGLNECNVYSLDAWGKPQLELACSAVTPTISNGMSIYDFGSMLNVSAFNGSYAIRISIRPGQTLKSIYYNEP
jgi:hypothetical protein